MRTCCPNCRTSFRVTPEQLKIRQGQVRCGNCREVFDALATLEEETILIPVPAPAEAETTPTAIKLPADDHRARVEPSFWSGLPAEHPPVPEEAQSEPAPEPEQAPPTVVVPEFEVAPAAMEPPAAAEAAPVEQVVEAPAPTHDEAPAEQFAEVIDTDFVEAPGLEAVEAPDVEFVAGPAEDLVDEHDDHLTGKTVEESIDVLPEAGPVEAAPEPEADPVPEPEAEAISVPEPLRVLHEDEPPRQRRWPWVVGSIVAAGFLALQALLHFRTELALQIPEAKPALIALCDAMGCELELPHRIEHISIETSDLVPDQSGHLQLAATLHNRAPFAQAWPHLELTLTDARDRALLRRALAPTEYLQPQISVADGFSARSEHAVQLLVEATDVAAVGYRLYVFYP